jgi:prepilin-type N-terminal cleavage/methylation domain-containing protein
MMHRRVKHEVAAEGSLSARRDRGFSLVEMVVTVALVGLAMIPLMIAAWTLVKNSSYNRNSTKVETTLSNAADRVNRAPEGCDYSTFLEAAVLAQKWEPEQVSAVYSWYEPGATATAPGVWQPGACPAGGYTDGLVQLVTITVESPDGFVQRSIQVVKSKI